MNKSSRLAPALGVTKFIIVTDKLWSHFVVLLKSDLDVQQTHLSLLNKSSHLALALSATKFVNANAMSLVTLCCNTKF